MFFIPQWVEAIWEVLSRVFKTVWVILKSSWQVIVVLVALAAALMPVLVAALAYCSTQLDATWGVLTDANDALATALAAGWPAEFAQGMAFANQYAPIAEWAAMLGLILTLWVLAALLRIIKSFIPTVAS